MFLIQSRLFFSDAEGDRAGIVKKTLCLLIVLIVTAVFPSGLRAGDYVIGDGDSLQISVWGSPELSITATVRPDGKISVPALGEIKASGLTPKELTAALEKKFKKIVKTPIVTVIVTNMTNYRIFVFGKGVPAGVVTLNRETTLLEFLSQLGPLDNADLENSYLVRNKKKIKSDFSALFEKGDFSQDIVLEPGDMLFIPDNFAKRISIVGAVANPTTVPYREGLTILDVILSAGGFTEFAKKNDVIVLRKKPDSGKKDLSGDILGSSPALILSKTAGRIKIHVRAKDLMKGDMSKNITMKPGDVVVVKESMF